MEKREKFRSLMKQKGFRLGTLSEATGINYHSLRRQIFNMKFKSDSITKIKRVLNLTDKQAIEFFLPNESEVEILPEITTVTLIKEKESVVTKPVLIDAELLEQIKELKLETGISVQRIIDKLIRFGLDHVEIIEE